MHRTLNYHLHIHLDSRIFPSHAHGTFAKIPEPILKNLICTTFSVFANLINFLHCQKDFYDILPTYFRCPSQRGQSLSTFFSLKNFISNFVNVNTSLSNFAKRKTSSSDNYPVATVYQSSDILRRPQNSGHLTIFLCHSLVASNYKYFTVRCRLKKWNAPYVLAIFQDF